MMRLRYHLELKEQPMNLVFLAVTVIFPVLLSGAAPTCESLGALALPKTTITIAESRPPGEIHRRGR